MAYTIRPLSFGETLDAGFRVFRDNFALLGGIAAVFAVPLFIVNLSSGHPFWIVIAGLATLLIGPVMYVALVIAIAEVYLGRMITIGDAYRSVRGIFTPVIGTALLLYLLLALAFVALVVPGIYLAIGWSLVFPVMIIERRFGMGALRRSRELVSGVWWYTLGLLLVASLIVRIPAAVLDLFWAFIPVIGPLLTAVVSTIASAYTAIVVVVYYFDRRCRTEDFDLRLLAEQIRAEGSHDESATDVRLSPAG